MPRNGSVGLNGRARLCEDAYTNRPGEVVAASSTAAALETAWAVRSAGTLTLASADAGFVVRGDDADVSIELPYSWRVDGEGFGSRQFRVEKASDTIVGATGAFTLEYEPDVPVTNVTVFTDAWLQHGFSAGASDGQLNNVMTIEGHNQVADGDVVGMWFDRWHRAYTNGSYRLDIPLKWFVEGGSETNSLPDNTQEIWLFSDGRMRVRKNGVSLERSLRGESHEVFD